VAKQAEGNMDAHDIDFQNLQIADANTPTNVVESGLKNFLQKIYGASGEQHFQSLKNALIHAGAVIAGGSILATLTNAFAINDIDIYVHASNVSGILEVLINKMGLELMDCNLATPYDDSFFRKNNIIARYLLSGQELSIDVMAVPDMKDLHTVVGNFDLSFCSVLYSGKGVVPVNTTFEDIRNKKGILRDEYFEAFLNGNKFILRRLMKYVGRGFKITTKESRWSLNLTRSQYMKKNLVDKSGFEWIMYRVLLKLKDDDIFDENMFAIPEYLAVTDPSDQKAILEGFVSYLKSRNQDLSSTLSEIFDTELQLNSWRISPEYKDYFENFLKAINME
jgi:hypothetical protein